MCACINAKSNFATCVYVHIRDENADNICYLPMSHLRFTEFGLALDVPISYVDVGAPHGTSFPMPMIKPTHFYQHLADLGKLDVLYGQRSPDQLNEFWDRFSVTEPGNTIIEALESGALPKARTIPMLPHGDEGRGKKRRPVMVVNTHAIIGAGCRAFDEWHKDSPLMREASMGVNLKGSSLLTRFLAFVMPKGSYGKDSCYLDTMFDELISDLVQLQTVGIKVGEERWHLAVIGCVGDLQFFSKLCKLTRSYSHVAKRSGLQAKTGICHLCLSGTENISFEDFSDNPAWKSTTGISEPWDVTPNLIRRLHVDVSNRASFLKPDVWHCMHLGAGKAFLSSSISEWLPYVPGPGYAIFSLQGFGGFAKSHSLKVARMLLHLPP